MVRFLLFPLKPPQKAVSLKVTAPCEVHIVLRVPSGMARHNHGNKPFIRGGDFTMRKAPIRRIGQAVFSGTLSSK